MCGIVGRINFNGDRINDRSLSEAAQSLIHRGPDSRNILPINNKTIFEVDAFML